MPEGPATVSVDVFGGHLAGLVLAEIDAGEGETIDLPASYEILGEVTGVEAFTGGALAQEARRHVS